MMYTYIYASAFVYIALTWIWPDDDWIIHCTLFVFVLKNNVGITVICIIPKLVGERKKA